MLEKVQTLTIEQFTIAFPQQLAIEGTSAALGILRQPRKKKKETSFFCTARKKSIFSSRAKRAHGREAPRKTLTRGSERSTENPTGAELLVKKGPVGSPSCTFGHFGQAFRKRLKFLRGAEGGGDLIVRAASHARISENVRQSRRPSSFYLLCNLWQGQNVLQKNANP